MKKINLEKLESLITSRRFILLLSGLAVAFSKDVFNVEISEDQMVMILTLIASWIIGDSIRKTEKVKEN